MQPLTTIIIKSYDPEYAGVFALREEILRKPLGMSLHNEDLSRDHTDTIMAGTIDGEVISCLMLHHISTAEVQLRQMAVAASCQGKGIGRLLVQAAEAYAAGKGYTKMLLHARKEATGFYSAMGYIVTGNEFLEINIPHYMMEKAL
jgi:predicted GNAT family N-acyltransferase